MTSDFTEISSKSFDYIVVGGSTAGCPLAANLSERFSMLLVDGNTNQTHEAYLNQPDSLGKKGDVILSAGALGSFEILMLSGIDPKSHFQNFGIPLMLDLVEARKEMQDNPCRSTIYNNKEHQFPDPKQVVGIAKDNFNASPTLIAIKIAVPESKGKLE
ncbi:unnamed protein product [Dovyalis caffra]|uniref:Glucose-methanol-choline oxidoreductase N-terminal domain-containing protein n=1 Tax=Dovyalis caffra TaxID=77055 RepID=A0AAV1QWE2_9ROSI|nr:unnamed protein product [Dovyalis caffra]